MNNFNDKILKIINSTMNELKKITDYNPNFLDKNLQESYYNIKKEVIKGIDKIEKESKKLTNEIEWNNLNISFFGETNAGKSTIIEALINGNGKSIGNGVKDYTRVVKNFSYKNLNLIDMPGIEGNEKKVIEEIKRAVNSSHIIFYVIGNNNKALEKNTIKKIKSFLNNKAKIYSILNLRGKPSFYKYKKILIDKDISTIENKIIKDFQFNLGKNYCGNIILNAYLALMANDNLEDRFKKDQIKAIELFKNKEKIKEFSNVNKLKELIEDLGKYNRNEVIISNTYKYINSLENIIGVILKEKKNFDVFLKKTTKNIEKYLKESNEIIDKYNISILKYIDKELNSLEVNLKKIIIEGIDNEESEYLINKKIKKAKDLKVEEIKQKINTYMSEISNEISKLITEFEQRVKFEMKINKFQLDIDIELIFEELKIKFKYILKEIIEIIFKILSVLSFVNIIGKIIMGVLFFIKKIWDWFFRDKKERKNNAKKKAISEIRKKINKVKAKITADVEKNIKEIKNNNEKFIKDFEDYLSKVKRINYMIDEYISNLIKCKTNLSTLLAKEFFGDNVKFCFIDLALSEAVIISDKAVKIDNSLLRLKNVRVYNNDNELFQKCGYYSEKGYIAESECNFRLIKSFMLFNNKRVKILKKYNF